jgi:hypothetical protein
MPCPVARVDGGGGAGGGGGCARVTAGAEQQDGAGPAVRIGKLLGRGSYGLRRLGGSVA